MTRTISAWIEPPDNTQSGEYWLTRRSADAAPGFDLRLPDLCIRYRWNAERQAWITGYYQGIQRREATLSCLHANNGWRIADEGVAP